MEPVVQAVLIAGFFCLITAIDAHRVQKSLFKKITEELKGDFDATVAVIEKNGKETRLTIAKDGKETRASIRESAIQTHKVIEKSVAD